MLDFDVELATHSVQKFRIKIRLHSASHSFECEIHITPQIFSELKFPWRGKKKGIDMTCHVKNRTQNPCGKVQILNAVQHRFFALKISCEHTLRAETAFKTQAFVFEM